MKRDPTEAGDQRIALFIDFENLVTRTGISPDSFDLQPAIDTLLEKGKVVFRRAYADWTRFSGATQRLHDVGVELVDVPPSTRAGKNGADMRLVIDALELAYLREHIDTFVIASGDSDFCPLAYKLRENDRTVIGMAVRESTSPLFVKACDEFVYLRAPGQQRRRAEHGKERPKEKEKDKVVPEVAREAVSAILSRATSPVNPSAIKAAIVRREPDFDERDHGFSSFSRLLEQMEKESLLRLEQGAKGQWYVVPAA
ncbi:MAG TPA: NYN domain-containing protein [Anaeromyxobacter sp.]